MKFAFTIFKYFPYGGVQRDMLRIAEALVKLGHQVDVYAMSWKGDSPLAGIDVHLVKVRGVANYARYRRFAAVAASLIDKSGADLTVGFNRMPGLDAYFAADPCFAEKSATERGFFFRFSGRYRWFMDSERAVFSAASPCEILLLTTREKADFQRWHRTPDQRFHVLPPYLSAERMALLDKQDMRRQLRVAFGFDAQDKVLLLVGSGFRTKGLDRAICALAALPPAIRAGTRLLAVGQDNPKAFIRLARELKVGDQVHVSPGRGDIPQLMQGADLLIHPARNELAGHVLLESMASGLPVLATDVCGYAFHIRQAGAGKLISSPFAQDTLNACLLEMLTSDQIAAWSDNGRKYARAIMAGNDGSAEAGILEQLARDRQHQRGGRNARPS